MKETFATLEEIQERIPINTKKAWNALDLTEQKFGFLTPIYRGIDTQRSKNHQKVWVCRCDCGQYTAVEATKLTTHTQVCCSQQCKYRPTKIHSLIGQRFGRLVVLERADNTNDGHARWKCQCDCGNITIVEGRYLENNRITSCGNCPDRVKSIGNNRIKEWLINHQINFVAEYRFQDCKHKTTLPFDFCILNDDNSIKLLIEYQGNLHYKATGGWINEEHLQEQQYRDQIKKNYCIIHNIPLLIIPYTELGNINNILEENIYAKLKDR